MVRPVCSHIVYVLICAHATKLGLIEVVQMYIEYAVLELARKVCHLRITIRRQSAFHDHINIMALLHLVSNCGITSCVVLLQGIDLDFL
jgi:hypothetical protein